MERLGVNGHHDSHTNKMELLRWAEGMCGITWKPQPKKSKAPRPQARHKTRNQFFGESLAILRWHLDDGLEITLEQFRLPSMTFPGKTSNMARCTVKNSS